MSNREFLKDTLDNGVTLVMERHPHVRSVSVGVWVRVGSSSEPAIQNGLSHFTEHMVFKGTKTRTPAEIASSLEAVGGELNAFTDREFTCYHANVLHEDLEIALDILSDILIRPTFPKHEIERERKILIQEMSMVEENPEDWITSLLFKQVWSGSSLGQPILGSRKTVQGFNRQRLLSFFKNYYRAENVVISVAGNFEFDELRQKCEKYFALLPRRQRLPRAPKASEYHSRRKAMVVDTEQLHLLLGFDGVGYKHPKRFDALVLSFYLGGGMSSRLFQEIREKAALAYSVECDCLPYSNTGLLSIYVSMAHRSLKKCLRIISLELEALKANPISEEKLQDVKGQLKGMILLTSDNMEARQESMGRNEVIFGRYISIDEVLQEIDKVTAEKLQELSVEFFTRKRESALALGRKEYSSSELTVF